jgi:hypothetical protein
MGAIAVFTLNTIVFAIRREVKNGSHSYSSWADLISNILYQVGSILLFERHRDLESLKKSQFKLRNLLCCIQKHQLF